MTLARKIIAPEAMFGGCHFILACRLDTIPSFIMALPVSYFFFNLKVKSILSNK